MITKFPQLWLEAFENFIIRFNSDTYISMTSTNLYLPYWKFQQIRQCQIDFLFSATWKKSMCNVLKFYFHKKSWCANRNFLFILSYCHGNAFLWKNLSWKSLQIAIFPIAQWKNSVFRIELNLYWIKINLAGWQLLTKDNSTFTFSPFYFYRVNWVGCLFHCNTGTLRKQSFLYHDVA